MECSNLSYLFMTPLTASRRAYALTLVLGPSVPVRGGGEGLTETLAGEKAREKKFYSGD